MTNDTGDENLVVAGNEMEFNVEESDDMFDDEYKAYGSNNEDDEFLEVRRKKKQMNNELLDELEAIRVENNDSRDGFNALSDELEACYQNSDDAESPLSSEDYDDEGRNETQKKRKYPRYRRSTSKEGVHLEVGMLFRDKKQLIDAIEDYRIYNGYATRTITSDPRRLQIICIGEGCEWKLWASKPQREKSFQIKKMPKPHSCIPCSFERGVRRFSSKWLGREYMDTFRLQPNLRLRELRGLIEKDHLYKPSMSMCGRTREKALSLLLGDYKAQFAMIRDYANELLSNNPNSTVKIDVDANGNGESIFKSLYICIGSLKRGFLYTCRRMLRLDACFLKGPWNKPVLVAVGRDANNQMYVVA